MVYEYVSLVTGLMRMPPNHAHLNIIPTELLGHSSLLSIRRQQLDEQTKAKAETSQPEAPAPSKAVQLVINVDSPLEMFQPHRLRVTEDVPTHIPAATRLQIMHAAVALLSPTERAPS